MRHLLTMVLLAFTATALHATDYYMSTTGSDSNNGKSREAAFATIGAAQKVLTPGDKLYILPGTYTIGEDQITRELDYRKVVFFMKQAGQQGKPICFIGLTENGERPVFDMTNVNPEGWRVTAFCVTGSYLIFRNFEVVGIQVNITDHTQSENFWVRNGHHNTFENIACHDGMGIGFYLTNNSHHNLFVNCDGYNNYDPVSENGKGGQNDAFGCHVNAGNEGNIFIGCRAWNNSDDGFDLINCYSPVTFCYSIAYHNGYDAEGNKRQDGNGFKAGGFGMGGAVSITDVPRHQVYHNLAIQNKSNGVYANHHLGGLHFSYNTSVSNGAYNYSLLNRRGPSAEDIVDVDGYGHEIDHNLSVHGSGKHVVALNGGDGQNTISDNSFTWVNGQWENNTTAEFESTNVSRLTRDRLENGYLDPATTLTLCQQKSYTGQGCDFSGYERAIDEAREISGAGEEPGAPLVNTYIDESQTWNFNDLTDGVITTYTNYNGLVMRGTAANNHGITTTQGSVSFYGNGNAIETSYLAKNKQAADDIDNTSYDRCLAFNTTAGGKTTVTFSAGSNNADRAFQIFFKAKNKEVDKTEVAATKAQQTIELASTEAGSFFIAATMACTVHSVAFELGGTTAIQQVNTTTPGDGCCYNLNGQRVAKPTRGLYIQNGKKYINK